MSREIDPTNLSARDVEYIRQRPLLRNEIIMQGFGDPLDPDYEGLAEKPDTEPTETDEAREKREQAEKELAEAEERERLAREQELEAQRNAAEEGGSGSDDSNKDPETQLDSEGELPPEKRWNKGMSKAELRAVIEARNADYDDDEQIDMPDEDKKDLLVAALEQDDKELFGDEE